MIFLFYWITFILWIEIVECFFINGAEESFADIILHNRVNGSKCFVASYGFGVLQVRKLLSAFDSVLLVADISHAKLNPDAYNTIVDMSNVLPCFSFVSAKTHAKFALIDDEIVIFTSANLSKNRRIESYLVGRFSEFSGLEKLEKIFHEGVPFGGNLQQNGNDFVYNVVEAVFLDPGGLHEPGYTHTVRD